MYPVGWTLPTLYWILIEKLQEENGEMQSTMEKLKNKASAAKEQADIYKAKIDEKVSFLIKCTSEFFGIHFIWICIDILLTWITFKYLLILNLLKLSISMISIYIQGLNIILVSVNSRFFFSSCIIFVFFFKLVTVCLNLLVLVP
jgi:hypothetical protein